MRVCGLVAALIGSLLLSALPGCDSPAQESQNSTSTENRVLVAVASNFVATLAELKVEFEASGPYQLEMAPGSTGKLYAQIVAGAPFDVFLAADEARPLRLAQDGLADRPFNYATGKLVLWTAATTEPVVSVVVSDTQGRVICAPDCYR